jgi:hypothetical protein
MKEIRRYKMKAVLEENTMITRTLCAACILTCAIILSSCSGLESKYYPGTEIAISEADLSDESIWRYMDDVYYVMRTASDTYTAATLKWDEKKGDYTTLSFQLVPSQLGKYAFLNIKGGGETYTIFHAAYDGGDSVVLFRANREKMEQDIADGIVNAHTNEHHTIIMDGSKEEQDEYILNNIQSMFNMDSPIFVKLISERTKRK